MKAGNNNPALVVMEDVTNAGTRISGFQYSALSILLYGLMESVRDEIQVVAWEMIVLVKTVLTEIYPPQNPVFCEFVKIVSRKQTCGFGTFEWE
ncbi:MAG: hypothetical protein IPK25_14485 [Saprospiraceae bacterium]|nr:hypothetical protein [Saprospiraceae bacterium]